jgi:hypothetical protein
MSARHKPRKAFVLRLEGHADNENAHVHTMRFFLKHLLRARSLKCTDAREIQAEEEKAWLTSLGCVYSSKPKPVAAQTQSLPASKTKTPTNCDAPNVVLAESGCRKRLSIFCGAR